MKRTWYVRLIGHKSRHIWAEFSCCDYLEAVDRAGRWNERLGGNVIASVWAV
jgi:hypothetical protein